MPSTATSLFSSALSISYLDIPDELQRPNDFISTRTESTLGERENTKPGLDLSRLEGFELADDRKRLKSFVWSHGWRLVNNEGLEY